jgi:hypothetical protein
LLEFYLVSLFARSHRKLVDDIALQDIFADVFPAVSGGEDRLSSNVN